MELIGVHHTFNTADDTYKFAYTLSPKSVLLELPKNYQFLLDRKIIFPFWEYLRYVFTDLGINVVYGDLEINEKEFEKDKDLYFNKRELQDDERERALTYNIRKQKPDLSILGTFHASKIRQDIDANKFTIIEEDEDNYEQLKVFYESEFKRNIVEPDNTILHEIDSDRISQMYKEMRIKSIGDARLFGAQEDRFSRKKFDIFFGN